MNLSGIDRRITSGPQGLGRGSGLQRAGRFGARLSRFSTLAFLLSGCLGPTVSDFNRTLDAKDALILQQCADLDNPVNAARIDALALVTGATQTVEAGRARREAYCEFKRAQVE